MEDNGVGMFHPFRLKCKGHLSASAIDWPTIPFIRPCNLRNFRFTAQGVIFHLFIINGVPSHEVVAGTSGRRQGAERLTVGVSLRCITCDCHCQGGGIHIAPVPLEFHRNITSFPLGVKGLVRRVVILHTFSYCVPVGILPSSETITDTGRNMICPVVVVKISTIISSKKLIGETIVTFSVISV